MPKKGDTNKKILITLPKPESSRSPYFDLAAKYNVEIDFYPFITVEPIPSREFRKQKIDITSFSAVIFTSKNAVDHFFRICEEMKISVSQDTKYFCVTEAVALYLQKFILYRKRKVFYSADGSNKALFDVISRHKDNEKFLYPCSVAFDSEITNWLKDHNCEYEIPVLYKITSSDIKEVVKKNYDIICFFTPGGVRSLFENFPKYKKKETAIGIYGFNTIKTAEEMGLIPDFIAPTPENPGMTAALEKFISGSSKK
ncbi:MAG: uroporphyrinogen-III synthase [Bacteroidetes bacterium]|nr:uroporphyrinogen-III synthase [Bacteroidota bacterium]